MRRRRMLGFVASGPLALAASVTAKAVDDPPRKARSAAGNPAGAFGSPEYWAREYEIAVWLVIEGRPGGQVRIEVKPSGVVIQGQKLEVPLPLCLVEGHQDLHVFEYRPGEGISHTVNKVDGTTQHEMIASDRWELTVVGTRPPDKR